MLEGRTGPQKPSALMWHQAELAEGKYSMAGVVREVPCRCGRERERQAGNRKGRSSGGREGRQSAGQTNAEWAAAADGSCAVL